MTPMELYTGFKQHNGVLPTLPGAPTDATPVKFTGHQMKQNLYNAQPQKFKDNYISAGKSIGRDSINDLVNYMEDQHKLYPAPKRNPRRNDNYNERQDNQDRPQGQRNDNNDDSGPTVDMHRFDIVPTKPKKKSLAARQKEVYNEYQDSLLQEHEAYGWHGEFLDEEGGEDFDDRPTRDDYA